MLVLQVGENTGLSKLKELISEEEPVEISSPIEAACL